MSRSDSLKLSHWKQSWLHNIIKNESCQNLRKTNIVPYSMSVKDMFWMWFWYDLFLIFIVFAAYSIE